jgi:hypothetical protein
MSRIFLAGWPKQIGGANTEAWHTLKMWRAGGLDVTVIPTWRDEPPEDVARIEGLGCQVAVTGPQRLADVPELPGGIVVAFCNVAFLRHVEAFRGLGCKIIWVGCMNWQWPLERIIYRTSGLFDHYVFQSNYQADQIIPQLRRYGDPQYSIIRGAFDLGEFPFIPLPHRQRECFVVGRLSRKGPDKFPADLWEQYAKVPHPIKARVMGWSNEIQVKCGPPPRWAEVLPEGAETAQEFLGKLHCLVPGIGGTPENWPRVGLEAMAAGVPIVAENKGGWVEMLHHLAQHKNHQAFLIAELAYKEEWRICKARWARESVAVVSNQNAVFFAWQEVLESLQ